MWLLWIPVAWTAFACVTVAISFAMPKESGMANLKEGELGYSLIGLWFFGPLGTAMMFGVLIHKLTTRKP